MFHVCTWLGKHTVPEFNNALGNLAGYLFYEITYDGTNGGYRFKSIDKLFSQSPKRKLISNDTPLLPSGYDYKIIKHYETTSIDIEDHLKTGAMFSNRLYTFDPYNKEFNDTVFNYKDQELVVNNSGVEFYKLATDLNLQEKPTRFITRFWDTGVLPPGRTCAEQIKKSKTPVFDINNVIRQSINRVNQLFTTQLNILVPMDLGIHVGDIIQCDFPEVTSDKTKRISDLKSGNYLIMDIAHRIHRSGSYSSLHLVRDTIYKK